jgi:exo-1,4-beta-D-glucosaminidase
MKKIGLIVISLLTMAQAFAQSSENFKMILKDGWQMQSATLVADAGASVSRPGYKTLGWYKVSVPTTIIAGLLSNKVYDFDPFYDMNFEKLKDTKFDSTWWFRKEFALPTSEKGKDVVLKLHGINYKANVWLNGVLIADSNQIVNPYRIISLNISKNIKSTGPNTLALEIKRPINPHKHGGDLAIDYADWIHYPPDYNAGIINNIEIKTYDRVAIQYPLVTTNFDLPSLAVAHLTVDALVINYSASPQDVMVRGKINSDILFKKKIHLNANETAEITFTPADFPQMNIKNPRIWWPWQYGKPNLNHIELSVAHGNVVSNTIAEDFATDR